MKSTLHVAIVVMLLSALLLSSCESLRTSSTVPPVSSSAAPADSTPATVPESGASDITGSNIVIPNPPSHVDDDGIIVELATPFCNGITEYNAFLKSNELSANFLYYEQLKMFGPFKYFMCHPDLTSYQYYLFIYHDEVDCSVSISFTEDWNNSDAGKTPRASADGITDIFTYPENQTVLVSFVPGTYHRYIHDKLASIIVQWGPRVIEISPPEVLVRDDLIVRPQIDPALSDDTTTIIGRLFHLSTTEDALREVIAANPFQ